MTGMGDATHTPEGGGPHEARPHPLDRAYEQIAEYRIEIARLRNELARGAFARELGEAVMLTATAGTIATPVSHAQLLRMIVETAAQVINARSAALFILDEEAQELIFEVALGPKADEVQHHRVPVGHGIAGLVALSGQPMAVSDASNDPRQAADIARSVGYLPQSILCVPLFYGDQVIGVLELLDKQDATSFSAVDIDTLGLFANQAAVAIAQSRAHGSLGELLNELLRSRGDGGSERQERLLRRLVDRVEGEDGATTRDAIVLAELVQEIVWRGDRERQACLALLQGFAGYLRAAPMGQFEPGAFR
jgi:GAF domain-containing protein